MPRTKVPKNAAAKRIRNSGRSEALALSLNELETDLETVIFDGAMLFEKQLQDIESKLDNNKKRLPPKVLKLKMGEVRLILAADSQIENRTNSELSILHTNNNTRNASKGDEGYITEESAHSSTMNQTRSRPGRPIGPFSSAKARTRRSQSAQNSYVSKNNLLSAKQKVDSTFSENHASRSKYRTPNQSRLQTMSADRGIGLVTPKIKQNTPITLYRYPKVGETVISLSGSPVIVQGMVQEGVNINIPVANSLYSMNPTACSTIDHDIVSQIDRDTLIQLRQLQANLSMIMSQVSHK